MSVTIRGQYELQQEIGSGGMGKVYQAKDLKLNRNVAIKRLLATGNSSDEKRRRFVIEAQAASALNHPNIITIFDIIEEDGADYMVMELLPGKTLQEVIPRSGLRSPMVIAYGVQISDGLATAHKAGIVHRDLKPGNIMISDRGPEQFVGSNVPRCEGKTTKAANSLILSGLRSESYQIGNCVNRRHVPLGSFSSICNP